MNNMESNNNRRNFLKSVGTLSLGAAIISPLSAIANTNQIEEMKLDAVLDRSKPQTISILQTTPCIVRFIRMMSYFGKMEKQFLEKRAVMRTRQRC